MKIHHTHVTQELRYRLDPAQGQVQSTETVHKASDIETISVPAGLFASCPQGATFARDWDLSFEVPPDVAEQYLGDGNRRRALLGWAPGPSPFAPPAPEITEPEVTKAKDA